MISFEHLPRDQRIGLAVDLAIELGVRPTARAIAQEVGGRWTREDSKAFRLRMKERGCR